MRILVCSDVPSAAQKIACLLEEKGYSVGTECDPAAARSGCGGYDAAVLVLSEISAWEQTARFFSLETSLGLLALLRECAREEGECTFAGLGIPILPLNAGSKTFLFALETVLGTDTVPFGKNGGGVYLLYQRLRCASAAIEPGGRKRNHGRDLPGGRAFP